jgi:uncharacterized protein YciI
MKLFVVIRTRGDEWNASLRLEEQRHWDTHASFMNGLASEGFVVVGGPLEDTPDVPLIMRAASEEEIAERLQDDPGQHMGFFAYARYRPGHCGWSLLPGASG